MHSFLSSLLTMSLGGSVLVLAALVLRFVFKKLKAPAWLSILLWAAVAIRLLIPSLPKSTVSVMPQPEAVSEVVEAMVPAAVQAPAPAQENDPTVSFPADDPRMAKYAELLYQQALLIEGLPLEDPVRFSNSICELMR